MTVTGQKEARAERLELYKLLVEMADRVSERRQAANSFYLTINTLLVGGSAYLSAISIKTTWLVAVAGVLVCVYWSRSILSYKTLNKAKFGVIHDIEKQLIAQPFTDEWSLLDPDGDGKKHNDFYSTEKLVPRIFIGLYLVQALSTVPVHAMVARFLIGVC